MPALENLSDDMQKALGKDLSISYKVLQTKETLKDDKDAQLHVGAVIKRFAIISNAAIGAGHAETKEKYLAALKMHGSNLAVLSFSKPDAVSNQLKELKIDDETIKKVVSTMEQAGGRDDDLCNILTSAVTCETSSALLLGGGHHHHGHHHHHHRHW